MDDLLSEKEQIDKMRAWWSDYGLYVIGGVVLGAAILFGINYYQNQTVKAEIAASVLYDEVTQHVVDGNLEVTGAARITGLVSAGEVEWGSGGARLVDDLPRRRRAPRDDGDRAHRRDPPALARECRPCSRKATALRIR